MDNLDLLKDYIEDKKFPIRVEKDSGFYDVIVNSSVDPLTNNEELNIQYYDFQDRLLAFDFLKKPDYIAHYKAHFNIKKLVAYYDAYSYHAQANWGEAVKTPGCDHEWIDVGFMFTKTVCKKCDKEKLNE